MDPAFLKRVSKRMALLLRHAPEGAGLVLDPEGYVRLEDLVAALRHDIPGADIDTIQAVVEHVEPHKQRYSIVDDCVRANYGHSTGRRIEHAPAAPPDILLHGTSQATVGSILQHGLRPMGRQYVHLTPDKELALSVGTRHGKPCLISVDAHAAHAAGIVFHKANFTFWLVSGLPAHYLKVYEPELRG
ncbi:MAG: RNA 2'-phosphotransferase [Rhizobacter sp.]